MASTRQSPVPSTKSTIVPSLSSLPYERQSMISLQVLLEQHLNPDIKLIICFSYLFIEIQGNLQLRPC